MGYGWRMWYDYISIVANRASLTASATPGCLWTTPPHFSVGGQGRAKTPM
jgi:hypothetical protein